jgi:hypothetical protein
MNIEYIIRFIGVVIAIAAADICYTLYFIKVAERKAIASGLWSTIIMLLGAFTVENYVQDKSLVLAAMLGAFIGTAGSVRWKALRETKIKDKQG